jgi:hypothetical protein
VSIQPSPAPDSATDPQPLAEVLPLPGVEPAEDIHVHTLRCSPLYGSTALVGRLVTDPAEVAAIRRRVEAHAVQPRRAARRLFRRIRGGAA